MMFQRRASANAGPSRDAKICACMLSTSFGAALVLRQLSSIPGNLRHTLVQEAHSPVICFNPLAGPEPSELYSDMLPAC